MNNAPSAFTANQGVARRRAVNLASFVDGLQAGMDEEVKLTTPSTKEITTVENIAKQFKEQAKQLAELPAPIPNVGKIVTPVVDVGLYIIKAAINKRNSVKGRQLKTIYDVFSQVNPGSVRGVIKLSSLAENVASTYSDVITALSEQDAYDLGKVAGKMMINYIVYLPDAMNEPQAIDMWEKMLLGAIMFGVDEPVPALNLPPPVHATLFAQLAVGLFVKVDAQGHVTDTSRYEAIKAMDKGAREMHYIEVRYAPQGPEVELLSYLLKKELVRSLDFHVYQSQISFWSYLLFPAKDHYPNPDALDHRHVYRLQMPRIVRATFDAAGVSTYTVFQRGPRPTQRVPANIAVVSKYYFGHKRYFDMSEEVELLNEKLGSGPLYV